VPTPRRFVRLTIGSLLAHDDERGSDLARTAEVLLGTGSQHAGTAAALQIQANTPYQRLDRIAGLLGGE
jgi:sugar diacid utilization regulator